jgi:hypothetical protein
MSLPAPPVMTSACAVPVRVLMPVLPVRVRPVEAREASMLTAPAPAMV